LNFNYFPLPLRAECGVKEREKPIENQD